MTDPNLNEELEGGLRTALRLLADDEGAVPGADIARARIQGRRAVRNRRLTRIVAPVAAAAVTAAAVGLAMPQEAERVAPAQGGQGDAQSSQWTVPVSFGWLPPGYFGTLASEGSGSYTMLAESTDPKKLHIGLTVFHENGKGLPWQWGTVKIETPETWAADPVHGREAHWVKEELGHDFLYSLRFQYAEDLWAQLDMGQAEGGVSQEVTTLLHRVADGLDLTERQVALPFQITGLPPELWTLSTEITDARDPALRKVIVSFRYGLRIQITPAGSDRAHKPNTTLDGHPAYRFAGTETRVTAVLDPREKASTQHLREVYEHRGRLVGSEELCVYGVQRFDVCLSTEAQVPLDPTISIDVVTPGPDWASEILKPSGGLPGLFRNITLIDGPVSKWSTAPLRD